MPRKFLAAAFTLSLASGVLAARQDPAPPPAPPASFFSGEGLPDGPGKEVVVKVCGNCHEPRRAASVRLTRDGWSATIDDMIRRGAKGTDDEFNTVLDYLAENFLGEAARPLNVNTASAIELESVAGLLRKEAAAVLDYRDKHGPFQKLDDMKKVPGLDFKKIDSRRDFLVAIQ
jgi:competence ComEA-like helix-hairpin-helix protein